MFVLIAGEMTTLVSNTGPTDAMTTTGSSQGNYDYWLHFLQHFQQYFSYIFATMFIVGEN